MENKQKRIRRSKYPVCGIYSITNMITGQRYIGQSKDIEQRFKEHRYHKKSTIDNQMSSIGSDNFEFELLEECLPDELNEKEKKWICIFESINPMNGYNIIHGGQDNIGLSNSNVKLTPEDVYNIREAYKNRENINDVYLQYKDKISISHFYNLWEGKSWNNIHMDVYENKDNKINNNKFNKYNLDDEFILEIRKMYVEKTSTEIYNELISRNIFINYSNLKYILSGNSYKHVPVYDKKNKIWVNKNN